jgi:hypothetical protein
MWPDRGYGPFVYSVQVLTAGLPFRGLCQAQVLLKVIGGGRPTKPKNASAIGLSDSLWIFIQRCWDGDMNARPKVTEVVAHLEEATANWDGLMPPGVLTETEDVAEDSMSSLMKHREFGVLVALDISHQAMVQTQFFNHLRVSPRRVPLVQWKIVSLRFRLPFDIIH